MNGRVVTIRWASRRHFLVCLWFLLLPTMFAIGQDEVEFVSGTTLEGKVLAIRKSAKEFDFRATIGGRTTTRTYPFNKVVSVTIKGKRYVLNEQSSSASERNATRPDSPMGKTVSRTEIERLIEAAGSTPPDWLDSVPLQYPKTLDLAWPLKPPTKQWNAQKNVGQYLWQTINPNPSRWQSGAKLIHHILSTHQDNPTLLKRDRNALANMYFQLFQDYPRAAYWFRKSGVEKGTRPSVLLAECYWRMGSKTMAMEELKARALPAAAIKLYADMGETERALRLAQAFVRIGQPHQAYLLAGDACRLADRLDEAVQYYKKVLQSTGARNADYEKRFKTQARESIEAIQLSKKANPRLVADGTYAATTTGYAGPLEVVVAVSNGHIDSVKVTKHKEKQFYAAMTDIPTKIVAKQSVEKIDALSGATITSQAIVNGTAKALANGTR